MREITHVLAKISQWHHDRNLVAGATDETQFKKLLEEAGELEGFVNGDGSNMEDHIGDIIVVLVNFCERHGTSIETCLNVAYEDIKDRTGKMIDGTFVKDVNTGSK